MNRQLDNIERIFQITRDSEPELNNQDFTCAVMQRINDASTTATAVSKKRQTIILWMATVLGVVTAAGLFPVTEFAELFNAFSNGVTYLQLGFATVVASLLAFSAYWVVEEDGLLSS